MIRGGMANSQMIARISGGRLRKRVNGWFWSELCEVGAFGMLDSLSSLHNLDLDIVTSADA